MRKPAFCTYEKKKVQMGCPVTMQLISAFYSKFQASSHLLWLYSLISVGPSQKPPVSHDTAQIIFHVSQSEANENPEDRFSRNDTFIVLDPKFSDKQV